MHPLQLLRGQWLSYLLRLWGRTPAPVHGAAHGLLKLLPCNVNTGEVVSAFLRTIHGAAALPSTRAQFSELVGYGLGLDRVITLCVFVVLLVALDDLFGGNEHGG